MRQSFRVPRMYVLTHGREKHHNFRFEPHRRHCIVVLEQDTFILASYWFNPERPVPV